MRTERQSAVIFRPDGPKGSSESAKDPFRAETTENQKVEKGPN